jgi:L-lactate dehydrogenase complex protein LldG
MSNLNSSSRATVLSSIRRSLGVTGDERPRLHSIKERMSQAPVGILPALSLKTGDELLALFETKVLASASTFAHLTSKDEIPVEVSRYLRDKNLPQRIKHGEDALFTALPFDKTPLEVSKGATDGSDLIGLSHASSGIAETGTLLLTSGQDNPTTLNFLPDYHIIVVETKDVMGNLEEALAKVRATYGKGEMPRLVNLITGPSRSGDIEQKLLFGAHGPRSLHVIMVD